MPLYTKDLGNTVQIMFPSLLRYKTRTCCVLLLVIPFCSYSDLDRRLEKFGVIARPRTHWYLDRDVVKCEKENTILIFFRNHQSLKEKLRTFTFFLASTSL